MINFFRPKVTQLLATKGSPLWADFFLQPFPGINLDVAKRKVDAKFENRFRPGGAHHESLFSPQRVSELRAVVGRRLRLTPEFTNRVEAIAGEVLRPSVTYLAESLLFLRKQLFEI